MQLYSPYINGSKGCLQSALYFREVIQEAVGNDEPTTYEQAQSFRYKDESKTKEYLYVGGSRVRVKQNTSVITTYAQIDFRIGDVIEIDKKRLKIISINLFDEATSQFSYITGYTLTLR